MHRCNNNDDFMDEGKVDFDCEYVDGSTSESNKISTTPGGMLLWTPISAKQSWISIQNVGVIQSVTIKILFPFFFLFFLVRSIRS